MKKQKFTLLSSIPFRIIVNSLPNKKLLFLFGILSRLPMLATPVLFGYFISTLAKGIIDHRVYILACGILFLEFIAILFLWVNGRLSITAFSEQERCLKEIVWTHIQNLPILVRDSSPPGVWMQKLSRDVSAVVGTCRMLFEAGLGFLIFFFGTFCLVVWKAPSISLIFIAVIIFAILTRRLFHKKLEVETKEVRECFYREGDVVLGLLEMLPILNLFGVTFLYKPLFLSTIKQTAKSQINQQKSMTDFKVLIQTEIWGVHAVVLLVCTYLFLKGGLKIGDIVMYDMLIAQMLNGLSQVMFILPQLDMGLEYAKSLKETLTLGENRNHTSNSIQTPASVPPVRHRSNVTARPIVLNLESVTFRYSPDKPPVITDFTANIHKGEFVCFLGRNGTGKSTLAKLLIGAYQPESGKVYSSDQKPAMIPQHIVIYRDSLLENVRLRDENISESIVETMLRQCGFKRFLDTHPSGLYTSLSPGSLSGGELQTLGIVRALVRNPETLILDELTNNLDIVAKEAVFSVLTGLCGQCTIILITHDITCLELADRVFVFHQDGISEIHGSDTTSRTHNALEIIRKEVKS
jgi:ATP-binding cassette, subfamily B, bacterial